MSVWVLLLLGSFGSLSSSSYVSGSRMKLSSFSSENSDCTSSCDGSCDSSCDFKWSCWCTKCDGSCDSDCDSTTEDDWYSDISESDYLSEIELYYDDAVLAYECYDVNMTSYYINEMKNGDNFDNNNEWDLKVESFYKNKLSIISKLSKYGLNYNDYRIDRLSHLSISKQNELGLKLNDKSNIIIPNIFSDTSCDDYYDTYYNDISSILTNVEDNICGGLTGGIGWISNIENSPVAGLWTEEVGITMGSDGEEGIYFSFTEGLNDFDSGYEYYGILGYYLDYSDISGNTIRIDSSKTGDGESTVTNYDNAAVYNTDDESWADWDGNVVTFQFNRNGSYQPLTIDYEGIETTVISLTESSYFLNKQNREMNLVESIGTQSNLYGINNELIIAISVIMIILILVFYSIYKSSKNSFAYKTIA